MDSEDSGGAAKRLRVNGDKGIRNPLIRKQMVYLIMQFMDEEKFNGPLHQLEKVSGIFFNMKYFEDCIINGELKEADEYLRGFTSLQENEYSTRMFFEIRKQRYLEALDKDDRPKALKILWKDLKIFDSCYESQFKEIADLLLMENFRKSAQLSTYVDAKTSRRAILVLLKELIEASPEFRDKLKFPAVNSSRLHTLISQSFGYQHSFCKNPDSEAKIESLFVDHECGQLDINPLSRSLGPTQSPAASPSGSGSSSLPSQSGGGEHLSLVPSPAGGGGVGGERWSLTLVPTTGGGDSGGSVEPPQSPVASFSDWLPDSDSSKSISSSGLTSNAVSPLKRPRSPVSCNSPTSSQPSQISTEINNLPPFVFPNTNTGKSHVHSAHPSDDIPKNVIANISQSSAVNSMDFHPSNQTLLLVGMYNGDLDIWEVCEKKRLIHRNFKVLYPYSWSEALQVALAAEYTASVNRVIWSPEGAVFGVAYSKNIIQLYTYVHGDDNLYNFLEVEAHAGSVWDIAFSSPTEELCVVTCGDDKLIKVWDALSGSMLYTFVGHEAAVYSVCPNHNANVQFIVSTDFAGKMKAWLYDDAGARMQCDTPGSSCTTMAFSADGTRLFSCGTNRRGESYLSEWDASAGTVKRSYSGLGNITFGRVRFDTTKNKYLAVGVESVVKIWNVDEENVIMIIDADGGLPALPRIRFNKQGTLLAISTIDNGFKILANAEGPCTTSAVKTSALDPSRNASNSKGKIDNLPLSVFPNTNTGKSHVHSSYPSDDIPKNVIANLCQSSGVKSMDFHPSQQPVLLVGMYNGDFALWDVCKKERLIHQNFKVWEPYSWSETLQVALAAANTVSVNRVIWSPDGTLFGVAYSKHIIQLYSYYHSGNNLKNICEIEAHAGNVWDIAFFSPTGHVWVVTCGEDMLVKVWNATTGSKLYTFEGHEAAVFSVCPNCTGNVQFIISTDLAGKMKAWLYDNVGARMQCDTPGSSCATMAYSADGTRLFLCGTNRKGESYLSEWDASRGTVKRSYSGLGNLSFDVVQFDTAKNKYLAVGEESVVKIWNMDEENVIMTIDADGGLPALPCIRFNKQGTLLAISTIEKGIKILANAEGLWTTSVVKTSALDPSQIASNSKGKIDKGVKILANAEGPTSAVKTSALDPSRIASNSKGKIVFPNTNTGQSHVHSAYPSDDIPKNVIANISQNSAVKSMDFHPSHQSLLLVGMYNGDFSIWEVCKRERLIYQSFKVWNPYSWSETLQVALAAEFTASVNRVIWSPPDGTLFGVAYSKHIIQLYSYYHGCNNLINFLEIEAHAGNVWDIVFFSPTGHVWVVTCGEDKLAKIWNAVTGIQLYTFEGHEAAVYSVCPNCTGNVQFIISTDFAGKMKAWLYYDSGARIQCDTPGSSRTTMAYSADGTRLFSCGTNKRGESYLSEWDASEVTVKRSYSGLRNRSIDVVQFDTAKNKYLAVGEESVVKIWNMDEENVIMTIDADGGLPALPCIRFNKQATLLAISTIDNGFKILANAEGPCATSAVKTSALDSSRIAPSRKGKEKVEEW